jgi:hypothetical protein
VCVMQVYLEGPEGNASINNDNTMMKENVVSELDKKFQNQRVGTMHVVRVNPLLSK